MGVGFKWRPALRKAPSVTLVLALAFSPLLEAEDFSTFTKIHDPDEAWSFGWALAMSGDTLVVGNNNSASGSVWIFKRNRRKPSRFKLAKRLTSPIPDDEPYFGRKVAIDGDTLAVNVGFSRSVLIFSRDHGGSGVWGFVKKIEGSGAVAVDGDLVALAVYGESVDIYQRDLGGVDNWGHLATIRPGDSEDPFAASLSVSGRTLVVGSAFDACGTWTDVCSYGYRVFEQNASDPTDWRQVLYKPGKGFGDYTGSEVLVDGPTLVSTDGIRERRRGSWDLAAPAAADQGLFVLALRQHSIAHLSLTSDGAVQVLDRMSGLDPAWRPVGELPLKGTDCGSPVLGPRELVVACPHGESPEDFGTVRIYPRAPLFSHGFEEPSLSGWTKIKRKVRLTVPGLGGSDQALAVDVDGSERKSFVRTRSLDREPSVALEFSLLPNRVGLAGQTVDLVHFSGHGRRQVRLTMREVDDKYRLDLWARQPGIRLGGPGGLGGFVKVGGTRIATDTSTRLGIEWQRASGPFVADGVARLTKKGRVVAERQDLATDRDSISVLTLGLPAGSRGTKGGTIVFDAVSVHR
ncbi:MAG: hypothetical protein GY769_12660 [bacterium]|nr:hypothetical protein [bacterium]